MIITGKLIYNHDLRNSERFAYNGHQMEKVADKNFDGGYFKDKDFKFSDKAFDLNWKTDELENFCKACDDLNIHVSINNVIWTEDEKQLAIDYIYNLYPVTSDFCKIDHSTIEDFLPYDYCSENLPHLMVEIDNYLNGENSDFYGYLEWMLEDEMRDEINYIQEKYGDEGILEYIKACYDEALKNFPNETIEYLHFLGDEDEISEYYGIDMNKLKKLWDDYYRQKFRLIEAYTLERDLNLIKK